MKLPTFLLFLNMGLIIETILLSIIWGIWGGFKGLFRGWIKFFSEWIWRSFRDSLGTHFLG